MALVIEDGTGVAGANSFVYEAEIIAYAALRGVEITEEEATVFAIDAMDYIETICFSGEPLFDLPFPRIGCILASGAELAINEVPNGLRKAQMQLALDRKRGITLTSSANPEQLIKRDKTGPLETEYFAPGTDGGASVVQLPIATAAMAPYACGAFVGFTVRTVRV